MARGDDSLPPPVRREVAHRRLIDALEAGALCAAVALACSLYMGWC